MAGKHLGEGCPFQNLLLLEGLEEEIASDDTVKSMRIFLASNYYCCNTERKETMRHLFLTALIASRLWR